MEDFAAIDFETANHCPSSVCSVGVVIVRGGEIQETFYSLINPEPDYYEYWNTRVHGLTSTDTDSAEVFPKVWARIAPRISGLTLVAHNSPFDSRCLREVMKVYQMDDPGYTFRDTLAASRRHFGRSLGSCCLDVVARALGYEMRQHHNALDDALACAHIALEIL